MTPAMVRSAVLVFTSFAVGTSVFNPSMSSALSLGFVLSAWFGFEVLEYLTNVKVLMDSEAKEEILMTSAAMKILVKRLDELEPRVQRIDNRTRRVGEP